MTPNVSAEITPPEMRKAPGLIDLLPRPPDRAIDAQESRHGWHSLLLALLLGVAFVPLLVFGILANMLAFNANQRQALDRLVVNASNREAQIENWIDALNVNLYRLTINDPALHDALQTETMTPPLVQSTLSRFRSALSPNGLQEITLISWDNRILVSTNETRQLLPERTCAPRVVCPFGPFQENGRAVMGVQYPFVGDQSQQIGLLIGLADTRQLDTILGNRAGLGISGIAYLIGADGSLHWLPGYGPLPQTRVTFPGLSQNVTPSEPVSYTGISGATVQGYATFIPLLNAWLIVEQAADEINQPIAALLPLTLALLALTLAAILVTSRIASRRVDRQFAGLSTQVAQLDATLDSVRNADQLKSLTIANMSHELRTPINATLNFSGFLLDGLFGTLTVDQTELIRQMHASSQHLLELINDLLDMSKIEAGQMRLFVTEFDPAPVFDQAIATLRSLTLSKPIRVEVDLPRAWPTLRGDRRRILQILLNLVSNAAKFTDHGTITLRVHVYATHLEIRIEDSGTGIDPADVPNLFEPFRQGYNALLLEKGGTGLGLPLSRIFARMHGGELNYLPGEHLPGERGGAVFVCQLPLDVIATDKDNQQRML